jgi:hypothetical protein
MSTPGVTIEPPRAARDSSDTLAVRQTALDYVEGWYDADGTRMARALHPDLAKRIVRKDAESGKDYLDTSLSAEVLVQWTWEGGGCLNSSWDLRPNCVKTPKESQRKDISIFDIYENQASAKVEFFEWLDYLHLAKLNGKWVIVNVLWQMKPQAS